MLVLLEVIGIDKIRKLNIIDMILKGTCCFLKYESHYLTGLAPMSIDAFQILGYTCESMFNKCQKIEHNSRSKLRRICRQRVIFI